MKRIVDVEDDVGETSATTVVEVSGLYRATSKTVVEARLSRRPGVLAVEANPVSQTATVTYDPSRTSVGELAVWIRECGYHCAGRPVPNHVCDPLAEPQPLRHGAPTGQSAPDALTHTSNGAGGRKGRAEQPQETATRAPQDVMGHGGHDAGMSMADMVRDMRNRFLVAALLSIPILLWSPIGHDVIGFTVAAPFGLRTDVFSLILSLPVIFYSDWIFFDGGWRALRAKTLDMMVLVAVAVGAGWLYSLIITLTGGGEVFYEAASVLRR